MAGYFGNAVEGMCSECTCNMLGTDPNRCVAGYRGDSQSPASFLLQLWGPPTLESVSIIRSERAKVLLINLFSQSLINYLFIHSFIHSSNHPVIHICIHLLIILLMDSFIHSFNNYYLVMIVTVKLGSATACRTWRGSSATPVWRTTGRLPGIISQTCGTTSRPPRPFRTSELPLKTLEHQFIFTAFA